MKRSLSAVSFDFCQEDFHANSRTSQSLAKKSHPRQSESEINAQAQIESASSSSGHIHADSGNCCASHDQPSSWEVKYRDNQDYDYSQDRNLDFDSWNHYSPDFGLDSYEYTQEISLSEISPAPMQTSSTLESYHYDVRHEVKWIPPPQASLYQPYEEPVQDAYVDI